MLNHPRPPGQLACRPAPATEEPSADLLPRIMQDLGDDPRVLAEADQAAKARIYAGLGSEPGRRGSLYRGSAPTADRCLRGVTMTIKIALLVSALLAFAARESPPRPGQIHRHCQC